MCGTRAWQDVPMWHATLDAALVRPSALQGKYRAAKEKMAVILPSYVQAIAADQQQYKSKQQ
jgi:hypothetical protein